MDETNLTSEEIVEETTENDESLDEKIKKELNERTAFINLKKYDLLNKKIGEIVQALTLENETCIQPEFIIKSQNALKLIFQKKEIRDMTIEKKISLFSLRIELEKPRERTELKKLVLYIRDIPVSVDNKEIINWIQRKSPSIKIGSEVEWCTFKDSNIKNGARSVLIWLPRTFKVPAFDFFKSTTMKKAIRISLWHYGMAIHCRKCFNEGHLAKDCKGETARPTTWSYASAITNNLPKKMTETATATTENSTSAEVTKEIITLTESLDQTIIEIPNEEQFNEQSKEKEHENSQQQQQQSQKVTVYHPNNSPFSRHYIAPFEVKNIVFKTVEHYLHHRRAVECGAEDKAEEIIDARTSIEAKKIGEKVKWSSGNNGSWQKFAYEKLFEGNSHKFEQHVDIREKLFATKDTILAEASKSDWHWGAGWDTTDANIHNQKEWRGRNEYGKLLTKLRDQMLQHPVFSQDQRSRNTSISSASSCSSKKSNIRKRQLLSNSPDNNNKQTCTDY